VVTPTQHLAPVPFDRCSAYVGYCDGMDVERIIDDIEQLQEMFEAPDIRPLSASDISAEIEGTTKCSPIALGFGCGSILASVADTNPLCSD
jgi:hypothetical protein